MSVELIVFIVIQFFALLFFVETMRRLSRRSKEFQMAESATTLPFGFVRLRHVAIVYFVFYVLWIALSLWIYFTLVVPLGQISLPSSPGTGAIQY